jgi:hypothetical protein
MPLRKLIADESITADVAQVMHDAYAVVLAGVMTRGLNGISSESIARKILNAVVEGERDAAKLAASILSGLK